MSDVPRGRANASEAAAGGLPEVDCRQILERLPVAVYRAALEPGSPTLYASPQLRTIFGLEPERLVTDPEAWIRAVHPDDRARVLAALAHTHVAGEPFREEYRFLGDDGVTRWILDDAIVVRDPRGEPLYLEGILRDVTERRRAEEERRASEATLRTFYDSAPLLMGTVELLEDDIVHVQDNAVTCRFFGVAAGDTGGRLASELGAPQDAIRTWLGHYRRSEQIRGPVIFEYRHGSGEGSRWLKVTVAPVGQGPSGAMRFCYVGEDHTERRLVEREMERASDQLRAIVDTTPLAVVGVDADLNVLLWNGTAEEMFGWKAEEVLGRSYPLEADDQPDEPDAIFRGALRGEHYRGLEIRRKTRDGRVLDLMLWNAPLLGADGRVRGLVGVMADTSDKKRLEAELRQAQKMEAVGRLAGGVAHDFNNVLTAISCNVEFLLEDIPPDDPRHGDVREVAAAAERGKTLTRQLLAFSKKQIVQPVVLDVNLVLRETESLLKRLLGEDVALTVDLHPDTGRVRADRGQLEQVLMNLAVNARDAMPAGGPLWLGTRPVTLDTPTQRDELPAGAWVEITMRDSGHGMSEETMAHVFEPFFTTKANGTGLGLATVYGIVQQAGGRVLVESREAEGTTFRVYIPAAEESPSEVGPGQVSRPVMGAGEVVLLVEDEPGVRKAAERILRQIGYRVLVAQDAESALDLAGRRSGPIHLLLTDVVMPGMNGRELAERLGPIHPETRTLFMSGYTEDEVLRRGVVESTERLVTKPFSLSGLAREVRLALEGDARDESVA